MGFDIANLDISSIFSILVAQISSFMAGNPVAPTTDYAAIHRTEEETIANAPYQLGLDTYNWQMNLPNASTDASYNAFISTLLSNRSGQIVDKINNDFIVQYNAARELIHTYNNQFINSRYIVDAYYEYLTKNKTLAAKMEKTQQSILKNGRLTYYAQQNTKGVKQFEKYTRWLYKLLCIICIIGIFLYLDDYTLPEKIGLVLVFIAYPYIIVYVLIPLLFFLFAVAHTSWNYFVHKDMYTYNGYNLQSKYE